ncbi:hypothetical protein RHMOL_Rhmol02G0002300 [Rhododendron molle]|uniref:Uncharacterized protein n=1 Tax=Rhododendron molle TaxID=49168 RepID=A0ACC0PMD4_RHOML|nr:hypothetical protein RHMOL_Rhmol02G0002300 [Rhododendron molle]
MEGSTGSCDGDSNVLCNCGIRAPFSAKGYLYKVQYAGKSANFKVKLEGNRVEFKGSGFGLPLNSSHDLKCGMLKRTKFLEVSWAGLQRRGFGLRSTLCKLSLTAAIYSLGKERNVQILQHEAATPAATAKIVV